MLVDPSESELGPDGVSSKAIQKDAVHVFLGSRFNFLWVDLDIPTQDRFMP